MIRYIKDEHMDQAIQLVKDYAVSLGFGEVFSSRHCLFVLQNMDICLVYTAGDEVKGIIGGSIYPSPWNPQVKTFHEEIYYLTDSARGHGVGRELLEGFVEKVEALGVDMSTLKLMSDSPEIEELYNDLGYYKLETTYIRR